MRKVNVGAIVRVAKGIPHCPNTLRYVGRTGTVDLIGEDHVNLRRGRGRYAGIAGYDWPLSSLHLERTGKSTEGKKRG